MKNFVSHPPQQARQNKFRLIVAALGWLTALSTASAADPLFWSWAPTPPMGWNSWDAFGSSVTEASVLANAAYMETKLMSHGWNLITIDIQWYEANAQKDQYRKGAILETDANGRLLPAPNRFPMTAETHSFKPIGDYLHARGLRFGLHLMRGIPKQAVNRDNAAILGTSYTATNIADRAHLCPWNPDMYGVDMSKPGAQEYYNSVFYLMASWGLDFVKVDDLAGHPAEIEGIRHAIDQCGRPIVLSVSVASRPDQAAHLATNANMWRISFDFWDHWPALYEQFANLYGHQPYQGIGHWPDADMLPFGHLKMWETNTYTKFTRNEQYTVMTLWSIARSPLIMGANMPDNDDFTLSLMTNDEVIAVDQASRNNRQLFKTSNHVAWVADAVGSSDKYVALFNTSSAKLPAKITVSLVEIGISGTCKARDLWARKDLGIVTGTVSAMVDSHGAVLMRLHPEN